MIVQWHKKRKTQVIYNYNLRLYNYNLLIEA